MKKNENPDENQQENSTEKKIYESDLSGKEKLALERQKLSEMDFKQKIVYIVDYYKIIFLIILIIGLIIYTGRVIYKNKKMQTVLYVAVVDVGVDFDNRLNDLQTEIDQYFGIEDEPYEQVLLDVGALSGNGIAANAKMSIIMNPNVSDVMICDKATYELYKDEKLFADWKEVLGDDYTDYQQYIEDDQLLSLATSMKWKDYNLVLYEPAYLVALKSKLNILLMHLMRQFL